MCLVCKGICTCIETCIYCTCTLYLPGQNSTRDARKFLAYITLWISREMRGIFLRGTWRFSNTRGSLVWNAWELRENLVDFNPFLAILSVTRERVRSSLRVACTVQYVIITYFITCKLSVQKNLCSFILLAFRNPTEATDSNSCCDRQSYLPIHVNWNEWQQKDAD